LSIIKTVWCLGADDRFSVMEMSPCVGTYIVPDINGGSLDRLAFMIKDLAEQSRIVCILLKLSYYGRAVGLNLDTMSVEGTENGGV
jgi:hypothetical protein